jgi:hypothetical protein
MRTFHTIEDAPAHVYGSGYKSDTQAGRRELLNLAASKRTVTIVHGHSSVLTCRGAKHYVVIPEPQLPFPRTEGSDVPSDGGTGVRSST